MYGLNGSIDIPSIRDSSLSFPPSAFLRHGITPEQIPSTVYLVNGLPPTVFLSNWRNPGRRNPVCEEFHEEKLENYNYRHERLLL